VVPVAFGVEVAQVDLFLETEDDRATARVILRVECLAPSRALVVKLCVYNVNLAI
jgi:hypothetical protein